MKIRHLTLALFLVTLTLGSKSQDTNWVKNNTWYFDNFVKDILPWSLFKETYIGVAPSPAGDFDQLFYDNIYKNKLAAEGHCYGMDVMAMLLKKNGGYLGFCHPPYRYSGLIQSNTQPDGMPSDDTIGPIDANLRRAIQVAHGNQINHGFLLYLLDVIAINRNRSGIYACEKVDFFLAKDDPPVISITKSLSPADGGHVLIPINVRNMGDGTKRIYVYDPNHSFYGPGASGHDFYTLEQNYIEVNIAAKSWRYDMGGLGIWSGNPGGGGNCIVIPLSVAGKRDRLPQSLLAEGAYALNTIFIHGNVIVDQFNDAEGRRYFNHTRTELETDERQRLSRLMPFIPFNGDGKSGPLGPAVYFYRGEQPVDIQYRATGEYRIGVIWHGGYYEMSGKGTGVPEIFRLAEMKPVSIGKKGF